MIPILDNGHGGVINNVYQTTGKRSPDWDNGILYEGMFNRWIINRIIEKLDRLKFPYYHVSPEILDIPLEQRIIRANNIYNKNNNTYLFSLHANAGGGNGIEGFTTKGITKSDKIAEMFLKAIEEDIPDMKTRFDYDDGDRDKEINFYLLRKFIGPAFLLECGFMDGKYDYYKLWQEDYADILSNTIVKVMKDIDSL